MKLIKKLIFLIKKQRILGIFNKKVVFMKKNEVLDQLQNNQISKKKAFSLLYDDLGEKKYKKANFVKIKIKIPDDKKANAILSTLFVFPFPIFIAKKIIAKRDSFKLSKDLNIDSKEIEDLIMVKGIEIDIKTKNKERVYIKTI